MKLVVGTMAINQYQELRSKARSRPLVYLHEALILYNFAPCLDSKEWALKQLKLYYQGYSKDGSY